MRITRLQYENALSVIERYKNQENINVSVGDSYKFLGYYRGGSKKPNLTIGKVYDIKKVRPNYRFRKIAVAIRDDQNILRWYSFNNLEKHWEIIN